MGWSRRSCLLVCAQRNLADFSAEDRYNGEKAAASVGGLGFPYLPQFVLAFFRGYPSNIISSKPPHLGQENHT